MCAPRWGAVDSDSARAAAAELVALEWSQVDFTAATLHVRRVKKGTPATHPLRGDEMRALRKDRTDPMVLIPWRVWCHLVERVRR